MQQIISEISSE